MSMSSQKPPSLATAARRKRSAFITGRAARSKAPTRALPAYSSRTKAAAAASSKKSRSKPGFSASVRAESPAHSGTWSSLAADCSSRLGMARVASGAATVARSSPATDVDVHRTFLATTARFPPTRIDATSAYSFGQRRRFPEGTRCRWASSSTPALRPSSRSSSMPAPPAPGGSDTAAAAAGLPADRVVPLSRV